MPYLIDLSYSVCDRDERAAVTADASLADLLYAPAELVRDDHPALRTRARVLRDDELVGPHLHELITRLFARLDATPRAVGLAAPQVGWPVSLFVADDGVHRLALANARRHGLPSLDRQVMPEGCLSLPGFEGNVARPLGLTIMARLPGSAAAVKIDAHGDLARIFDHEIDHLEGRLYIDRLIAGTFRRLPS